MWITVFFVSMVRALHGQNEFSSIAMTLIQKMMCRDLALLPVFRRVFISQRQIPNSYCNAQKLLKQECKKNFKKNLTWNIAQSMRSPNKYILFENI